MLTFSRHQNQKTHFMMTTLNETQIELKTQFLLAKSSQEMLKILEKMESCFDQEDLGLDYLSLAKQLHKDGFLEKAIFFGKKALSIFLKNHNNKNKNNNSPCLVIDHSCDEHASSVSIAFALQLLGTSCFDLNLSDESFNYFNWASKNLSKIELDLNTSCGGKCVLDNLISIHSMLFKVKAHMGRKEESVDDLVRILGIKEVLMEEECVEIGVCNRKIYEGYLWGGKAKEALPFCLKALEIFRENFGGESVEVAKVMVDLGAIYYKLGEVEKAFEQKKLAQSVLKKTRSCTLELLKEEIEKGRVLIGLGKYEEAVGVLKGVVSLAPNGGYRAIAFVTIARAFFDWQKCDDAIKYLKRAGRVLEQKELDSAFLDTVCGEMSSLYQEMNDFCGELAVWCAVLSQSVIPQKLLVKCAARIFSLVSAIEKEKELISLLKLVVELLKQKLGPNHCEVGYNYARLGLTYMKVDQEELGVKFMADAKDILTISLGPCHLDSLRISQMLAFTYGTMKRYGLALQLQEEVIQGLKGLGSNQEEFMDEAVRLLNRLKKKVAESCPKASSESKDGKDLCAKISKCGISDVGKVTK